MLTGIDVRFAGFDAYDVEPRKIPDLFASRPIVVFGKWRGSRGGSIEISGRTGRGAVPHVDRGRGGTRRTMRHRALRHLWARTRIANLADFGLGAPDERSASSHHVARSHVRIAHAVHVVRRRAGDRAAHDEGADDVDQPLPLPRGVAIIAVGVTSGAEPELVWVVAALLAAIAVSLRRTARGRPRSHRVKRTLGILLLVALAMWGMKRYYAEAPVDELQWILGPTATLVTALTGVPFEWEPGQGYLSRERFFLIEKACAGINFMIAAFGMVAFVRGRRVRSCRAAAGVLLMCVLASYSAAVLRQCGTHRDRDVAGRPPGWIRRNDRGAGPSGGRHRLLLRRPRSALSAGAIRR